MIIHLPQLSDFQGESPLFVAKRLLKIEAGKCYVTYLYFKAQRVFTFQIGIALFSVTSRSTDEAKEGLLVV